MERRDEWAFAMKNASRGPLARLPRGDAWELEENHHCAG
jgi:hypothetical protein